MIKAEMKNMLPAGVNVDISEHLNADDPVLETSLEIKSLLFFMMSDAFVKLVDKTGEDPGVVGPWMCDVIGIDSDDFTEFISTVMG